MPRGFAGMSPARRKEIAKRGAERLHKEGKAHKYDSTTGLAAAEKRHANAKKPVDKLKQV
jgi:hypothetical protein